MHQNNYIYFMLITGLFLYNTTNLKAQQISVIDQNSISITNNYNHTHKFELRNGNNSLIKTILLDPKEKNTINLQLSKGVVKTHKIIAKYDVQSYKRDLALVKRNFEYREEVRRNQAKWGAALRFLDQQFNNGNFFKGYDNIKLVVDKINGKGWQEWGKDLAQNLGEGAVIDAIDNRTGKGLAAAAFKLKELFIEGSYPDLDRYVNNSLNRLNNGFMQSIPLKNRVNSNLKSKIEIEGDYLLNPEYIYLRSENLTYSTPSDLIPFSGRMNLHWYKSKKASDGNSYFTVAYTQSPIMYQITPDEVFTRNLGLAFQHIDAGFGYNYHIGKKRELGLNLFFELSARANFRTTYSLEMNGDTATNFQEVKSREYDGFSPQINGGISIDLKVIKLIGRYEYTPDVYNRDTGKFITKVNIKNINVGVAIPLVKKYSFY